MKFLNFGCWNKGKCKLDSVENPVSAVMQHIHNQVISSIDTLTPYEFIVVSGDNYYPSKLKINGIKTKTKMFNETDLSSGFDCLDKIPIKKYILFGNHEYNDKYDAHDTINHHFYNKTPIYCLNIQSQLNYSETKKNFEIFKDTVMLKYDDKDNTLLIMIDTTIYDTLSDEELLCYHGILGLNFGTTPEDRLARIKTRGKETIINAIRNRQLNQVIDKLTKFKLFSFEKIIFVGHHPIINCRIKKSKETANILDNLKDFFKNIYKHIRADNIIYLCADTHFYQKGIVNIVIDATTTMEIEQHIVGTGGSSCDLICKKNGLRHNLAGDLTYNVISQIQEYGYLKYERKLFEFVEVPFKLAYYTEIDGKIKVSKKVNENVDDDSKLVCQTGGGRKYKIIY
jgi:hypothetical protein